MKRFILVTGLVFALGALGCAAEESEPAFGSGSAALANAGPPQVIAVAAPGYGISDLRAVVAAERGAARHDLGIVHGLSAVMPDQAAAQRLAGHPAVLRVDPDLPVHATAPPGACSPWPSCKDDDEEDDGGTPDPQVTPWGITRTGADTVWSSTTGAGVNVVVIDTGGDKDHGDLDWAGGVNYVSNGPSWKAANSDKWDDDNGHGTHVAGTVAALDNDHDVVGMAPDASIYACKALDRNGSGYLSDVIACIDWAVVNGMDVANMSLGASSGTQSLQDACDNAEAAGVTLVAAAGNSGDGAPSTNEVGYPAKYASVIAVAATADDDSTPYWSSEGEEVELAAPGVDVLSTWNDGSTDTKSGTSMASPHTAGAAVLLVSDGKGCVRERLAATAEDLGATGRDNHYGYGLVDVPAALAASCP